MGEINEKSCEPKHGSDRKSIGKSKVFTYFILTVVFIGTSFLSLFFIFQFFSDKSSFISLRFLTVQVVLQLAGLLTVYFLLDTLRFFYILKTLGFSVGFGYMVKLAFINLFISTITPFATGGGFAQIYFLNKKGVTVGNATAAATLRTLLPIFFFFISTPVVLFSEHKLINLFPDRNSLLYIVLLAVIYGTVSFVFYKVIRNVKLIKGLIFRMILGLYKTGLLSRTRSRKLTKRLFREIERFAASIILFMKGKVTDLILSVVFTILFLLALFTIPFVLIHGMGYQISFWSVVALQIIITFIMYFAPTPGATGIAEGGFSLIFSGVIGKAEIVTLTFAWRFFSVYVGTIIGFFIFYRELFKGFLPKSKRDKGMTL